MIEIAAAITLVALAAWDIGCRYLARERKEERARVDACLSVLRADVDALTLSRDEMSKTVERHERQLSDLRGTQVQPRRAPTLTGVGR
jgi:hypothetical protein